jgi:isopentenyl-diphosphate delta-isomerase type 1
MKDDQSAIFIVVDEKDKIIGYKSRYECHHNPHIIHRAVDIILFNNKGEVLLQKRSRNKDTYPGYYTVSASGHVDKGETYLASARREITEELGIPHSEKIKLTKIAKYIIRLEHEAEMTVLYTGVYNGPIVPAPDEVESVEYVKKERIPGMKKNSTPGALAAFYKCNLL